MTEKRFKFNGRNNCIEYDGKSILLDSYGEDIEDLLNELNEDKESFKEFIAYQSELIDNFKEENQQIRQTIYTLYNQERTDMGKKCFKTIA